MWLKMNPWVLPAIFGSIGLFYLIMGLSLMFGKKKKDHSVSGVPLFGGIHFLIAGLISPCKWLAFLCVLDYVFIGTIYKLICPNAYKRENDLIDEQDKQEDTNK